MNTKMAEELLFERYLREHGRDDFIYEQPLAETSRVPDYQLPAAPKPLLFEVKGFDVPPATGFGYYEPYLPVRKKIDKAKEKFRDLEDYSCSLVLHYAGDGLVSLDPLIVFGAMLGDIGFQLSFDPTRVVPVGADAEPVFTNRGRMIRYAKGGQAAGAINTTINAIIVIEEYPLGRRRFGAHYDALTSGRPAGARFEERVCECLDEIKAARGTERDVSLHVLRAIVNENPFARIPLSQDLFVGPCDERYGVDEDGNICRLFAGSLIADLEEPAI